MFSGIVECTAKVLQIEHEPGSDNAHFTRSPIRRRIEYRSEHSTQICVCLTVVSIDKQRRSYVVTAIRETLERSNLWGFEVHDLVNLERSMLVNGRLDGHIVQGHVDTTGTCVVVEDADGSTYFTIQYSIERMAPVAIPR